MEIVLSNVDCCNLKKINLCIFDSKVTAIIGDNASGKSMIGEIIATIKKPDCGKFIVDKKLLDFNSSDIDYNRLRFDIGMVVQNYDRRFFSSTVKENMEYQLAVYNYKKSKKRIVDSLKMVGLNELFIDRKIKTLSDSERFKVALATVLSINPKVIILDDPTCFLDEDNKEELYKLIKMMKLKYNKTIVILSNDTEFILRIADYIYVLNNNKIFLHGDKYNVLTSNKLDKTNIHIPEIIKFQKEFRKKTKIKLEYRDNVNDLIKDIYFNIEKKFGGRI